VLCFQVSVKALKMPPAHQAFNRIATEIARDIVARFKRRRDRATHRFPSSPNCIRDPVQNRQVKLPLTE
jgi:hypothetical protein